MIRQRVKEDPPGRGDSVSVFVSPSYHKTQPLVDITLEWEQRKKRRVGGGAPCESRKTVFCVPCPVASDSCHDQASAWLLGDVAEREKSSSVAGVRVMYLLFMLCMHHLSLCLSLLKVFFIKTNSKSLNDGPVTSFCSTRTCCHEPFSIHRRLGRTLFQCCVDQVRLVHLIFQTLVPRERVQTLVGKQIVDVPVSKILLEIVEPVAYRRQATARVDVRGAGR